MSISRDRLRTPALILAGTALSGTLFTAPSASAAPLVAPAPVASPTRTVTAAPTAAALSVVQARRASILRTAKSLKGRPYRYGASGPSAFDCSGYTSYVFKKNGITLPRTANQQFRATRRIAKAKARPGDLVFFGGSRKYHVGIYAGDGYMWHSPRSGKTVRLIKIWTSHWSAGRVIG